MAKTSFISRSYSSDQSALPSEVPTSCTLIRRRFPALRTLPSSTVLTPSFWPISSTTIVFPFNAKTVVRAGTFSPCTFARALISSSVILSLKYSLSGSELMLTKGRMAIEALLAEAGAAAARSPGVAVGREGAGGLSSYRR